MQEFCTLEASFAEYRYAFSFRVVQLLEAAHRGQLAGGRYEASRSNVPSLDGLG